MCFAGTSRKELHLIDIRSPDSSIVLEHDAVINTLCGNFDIVSDLFPTSRPYPASGLRHPSRAVWLLQSAAV